MLAISQERMKELLPVMQAFAEGRTIQQECWNAYGDRAWRDVTKTPEWSDSGRYRIKPEPKFRPFKQHEVPVGRVVVGENWRSMICAAAPDRIYLACHVFITAGKLLNNYKFEDGSRCGVFESEE